jgi:hypothetical protein
MWRRGNWQRGFAQRFGHYDAKLKQNVTNSHVLWAHAVSVGEVNICPTCPGSGKPIAQRQNCRFDHNFHGHG